MKDFFLKKRRAFFAGSVILIIFSMVALTTKGLVLGMDFIGGTKVEYRLSKVGENTVIEGLKQSLGASPVIFYTENSITIKVKKNTLGEEEVKEKIERILDKSGLSHELISFETISPKFGEELKNNALISILISFGIILLYILYRYELRFSFSAILTLIHDVLVTLLFLSLLSVEITTSTIAAVLTLIGYSLNDTIVLFDRIRTALNGSKSLGLSDVIRVGIERNLSRMLLTSLTTLFAISALLIFGGEGLFSFSITLFLGIIIGTYSSIFVSSSLLEVLKFNVSTYRTKQEERRRKMKEKERLRSQFENSESDLLGF